MNANDLQPHLKNVGFTLPTPFGEDKRTIQYDSLQDIVQFVADAGGELFIPCGNSGEYYSLDNDERVSVVETVTTSLNDTGTVVAGADGHTTEVLEMAEEYEKVGADGVMVIEPPHAYIHKEGLVDYYTRIADESPLPIVLYKRGPGIPDDAIVEMTEHENVAGVKYAESSVDNFARTIHRAEGNVIWLTGNAERYAPSYCLEGAHSFTTGIGNFVPEPVLELDRAIKNGDWERSLMIRNRLRPYEDLRGESGDNNSLSSASNVPAIKTGLELIGLYGGPVRPPLVELSDDDQERARQYYEKIAAMEI